MDQAMSLSMLCYPLRPRRGDHEDPHNLLRDLQGTPDPNQGDPTCLDTLPFAICTCVPTKAQSHLSMVGGSRQKGFITSFLRSWNLVIFLISALLRPKSLETDASIDNAVVSFLYLNKLYPVITLCFLCSHSMESSGRMGGWLPCSKLSLLVHASMSFLGLGY